MEKGCHISFTNIDMLLNKIKINDKRKESWEFEVYAFLENMK